MALVYVQQCYPYTFCFKRYASPKLLVVCEVQQVLNPDEFVPEPEKKNSACGIQYWRASVLPSPGIRKAQRWPISPNAVVDVDMSN